MFVIYGAITNVSIGRLFLGASYPALDGPLSHDRRLHHFERAAIEDVTPSGREVIRITIDALPALVMRFSSWAASSAGLYAHRSRCGGRGVLLPDQHLRLS